MKNILKLLTILCIHPATLFAQDAGFIKGVVVDTGTNMKLVNASVAIIRAKDSILVKFTRTGINGEIELHNLSFGKMLMLVHYPGYARYLESFTLDSANSTKDFNRIRLTLKADLLKEVIIKGTVAAITIKGDTTEFNAAAYHLQPNAKVEDLLKQLPNIQVDRTGKITAQGVSVGKVLLDGEEFFGDDPTLITQNIRGDMVDKVQLFDKKSDQAAFTGIDDGQKIKTINIKLKEDKKNGYFGKFDVGAANQGYFKAQAMFNLFKDKTRFAAYGTLANTGKVGLAWSDNQKYGGASNRSLGEDGTIYLAGGSSDLDTYDGRYNNQGIPLAKNTGTHYETKWDNDKQAINLNYKIGSLMVDGTKNNQTQNNLPNGIIEAYTDQSFNNSLFRQKLDASYVLELDSTSSLKIKLDGTLKNNEVKSTFFTRSLSNDGTLLNDGQRTLTNDGQTKLLNSQIFYSKKFKRAGRTLTADLGESIDNSTTMGYLKSLNNFYSSLPSADSTFTVDQYKTSQLRASSFRSNVGYTDLLAKNLTLVLNYGLVINSSSADRKSLNKTANETYTDLDSLYSNNYKFNQRSNQLGAIFNFKINRSVFIFGTKITNVDFKQSNIDDLSTIKRSFINWAPQALYSYIPSQQKQMSISYNGFTTQPNINQIQPVLINTDPLNITLGNPGLRPSFQNNLNATYNAYSVLNNHSLYLNVAYGFTANAIVTNTTTDGSGKSTYLSNNLISKQPHTIALDAIFSKKITAISLNTSFSLNLSSGTFYNLINNVENQNRIASYSGILVISKYNDNRFGGRVNFGPTYTKNESSIQSAVNDNGWGYKGNSEIYLQLPLGLITSAEATYQYRGKTKSFGHDFSRLIINAALSKKFLKSEALKLNLSVDDLFNQNVGFSRNSYANTVFQESYTTIRRYLMASLSYDLNQMGGPQKK